MKEKLNEYILKQELICRSNDQIPQDLYMKHGVNRGLRDLNGNGVLTGLTNISKIKSFDFIDGIRSRVMENSGIEDIRLKT